MKKLMLFLFMGVLLLSNVSALSSGESTIIFGSIFSMIFVVIFFLVLSIMSPNVAVKIFFLSLATITLVLTVGIGVTIINEFFTDFSSLVVSYGAFYRALTILLTGGGMALILYLVVVAFKSFNSSRGLIDPEVPGLPR